MSGDIDQDVVAVTTHADDLDAAQRRRGVGAAVGSGEGPAAGPRLRIGCQEPIHRLTVAVLPRGGERAPGLQRLGLGNLPLVMAVERRDL